jgi:hypothetical protein
MCCFEPGLVDFGVECIDIGRTFLQGDGAAGYEVSQWHYGSGQQLEVGGFGYVKREYGVSSCDGQIWWASHMFMRNDSICPKYWVYSQRPSLLVTIDDFEQSLADIKMRVLYSTMCSRVVSADPYMIDMIALWEVLHCFEESWTIVSNNLTERSPLTKDILVDPVS